MMGVGDYEIKSLVYKKLTTKKKVDNQYDLYIHYFATSCSEQFAYIFGMIKFSHVCHVLIRLGFYCV